MPQLPQESTTLPQECHATQEDVGAMQALRPTRTTPAALFLQGHLTWIICVSACLGTTKNSLDRGGMLSGTELKSTSASCLCSRLSPLQGKRVINAVLWAGRAIAAQVQLLAKLLQPTSEQKNW